MTREYGSKITRNGKQAGYSNETDLTLLLEKEKENANNQQVIRPLKRFDQPVVI